MAFRPAPSPRRGRGWLVLALVLVTVLLGGSLLLNFALGLHSHWSLGQQVGRSRHGADRLHETVIEDNGSSSKIAVIDIQGVISGDVATFYGDTMVDLIRAQLERAGDDDDVKAVILRVDSPGGEVLASDEIYRLIEEFQKDPRHGKPVIASMGGVAASGGYYVSAPCRWIVANELTITGSIGVIMHTYNYRGLMDKVGVQPRVFKSGKLKDMLSPDKRLEDELPEERALVDEMIQETYARFKKVVADGRANAARENGKDGRKLDSDWESLADGRILSGRKALDHGFVDELGNFEKAVERAKEIAGMKDANVVGYHLPPSFFDLFRFMGQANTKSLKLDLGVELPRLQAGRLYFLAPTYVQ
jgi:protease-4